jgi:E3 ubiquitin-protein ligase UBR2
MLLEHASKKEFAAVFTNSYGSILKDFINDDHEHSYSVSSLSVQLFTVPTLAHHLIAKHDVLATLLRTFISECERKR